MSTSGKALNRCCKLRSAATSERIAHFELRTEQSGVKMVVMVMRHGNNKTPKRLPLCKLGLQLIQCEINSAQWTRRFEARR